MKLSDWARSQGISYLTSYRWFKDGKLPVKAYQTESGTIIVEDNGATDKNNNNENNDTISLFLKKTVEFSKNNSTIEDFAAYILSNFTIQAKSEISDIKYSKKKPKSEEIQEHYRQFLVKGEKPKPNMFVVDENVLNTVDKIENDLYQPEFSNNQLDLKDPSFKDLVGDLSFNLMSNNVMTNSSYGSSFNSSAAGLTFGGNTSYCCNNNDSLKLGDAYIPPVVNFINPEPAPVCSSEKPKRGRPRKNK